MDKKVFIITEHGESVTGRGCDFIYESLFGKDSKEEADLIMGTMYNYINTLRYKAKEAYAICVVYYDGTHTHYDFIEKKDLQAFRDFSKPYRRAGKTSYEVCKMFLDQQNNKDDKGA